jgi:hypothetical protein
VGTSADVDPFAGSVKGGVPGNVGDTGDYLEALVEGDGQAGADAQADLLPDVEHATLNGEPGG